MDLVKIGREVFDGAKEAVGKFLQLVLLILILGVAIAAAYLGLNLVEAGAEFVIDLIGSVQGLVS